MSKKAIIWIVVILVVIYLAYKVNQYNKLTKNLLPGQKANFSLFGQPTITGLNGQPPVNNPGGRMVNTPSNGNRIINTSVSAGTGSKVAHSVAENIIFSELDNKVLALNVNTRAKALATLPYVQSLTNQANQKLKQIGSPYSLRLLSPTSTERISCSGGSNEHCWGVNLLIFQFCKCRQTRPVID